MYQPLLPRYLQNKKMQQILSTERGGVSMLKGIIIPKTYTKEIQNFSLPQKETERKRPLPYIILYTIYHIPYILQEPKMND